jgi:hypothetical protein
MKFCSRFLLCLFALIVVAGCASTNVTQQTPMSQPGLARPNQIWVYNFVANPADMPADSSIAGQVGAPSTPPTQEQLEQGRQLGAQIATELVADINAMGFGAGTSEMDTVVEGYAVTPQGWRKLGSGTLTSSGNKTPGMVVPAAVAIATANPIGLIVVGGAKIYGEASGRNGLQGRAKATADEIAAQLRIRFQDRGWIQ